MAIDRPQANDPHADQRLLRRSERRLCGEVHLKPTYRWLCRLGREGDVPDQFTFLKNSHARFRGSDLPRKLFKTMVEHCMAEGLVGGNALLLMRA